MSRLACGLALALMTVVGCQQDSTSSSSSTTPSTSATIGTTTTAKAPATETSTAPATPASSAKPAGRLTASGLRIEDLQEGTGAMAEKGRHIEVHYTGWLADGSKFSSSRDSGRPYPFTLGAAEVIPGWDEGIPGMKIGGKRRLTIPPQLAYGSQGTPGGPIPPNATLVFEIELIDVK
jgi:FKBP-type peptidyl-prolyl cis-trans isomerase